MNDMHTQTDPSTSTGTQLKEKLQNSYESGKESVSNCCSSLSNCSSKACESACDCVRKNPIASVIGAAFVGAAVCYLILEGRSQPTFRDRYVSDPLSNAADSVNDSLKSIYDTLKFW